jgi:hypothetical protein
MSLYIASHFMRLLASLGLGCAGSPLIRPLVCCVQDRNPLLSDRRSSPAPLVLAVLASAEAQVAIPAMKCSCLNQVVNSRLASDRHSPVIKLSFEHCRWGLFRRFRLTAKIEQPEAR